MRVAAIVAGVLLSACAVAQDSFPSKPIRVIVPLAAGSTIDIVVRLVSDKFQQATGQPMLIDTRAGASGVIGAEALIRSPADGYTLMVGTVGQMSINPHTFAKLPYDPLKSFAPITQTVRSSYFWVVGPASPATNVRDYLAWAKANPGNAAYASTGIGSLPHFAGVMLQQVSGVEMIHVPYKGGAQQIPDLLSGRVSAAFSTLTLFHDHLKAGKVRVLAAAMEQRSNALPDVPTFAELGYKDVLAPLWSGLVAPAGTPAPIITLLNREVVRALNAPDVKEKLLAGDQEPAPSAPAQFAEFIRQDNERWGRAIRASGVKQN
jgi:tripartite-type tricarboxylate transporter receptor subunit TctC